MKSSRTAFLILILGLIIGCGGGGGSSPPSVNPILADNALLITVNGSLCSGPGFLNKPCVSVTICTPGTATCQRIDDILLDTGSFGLRIFKDVLTNVSPTQVTVLPSGSLAECIQFADGTSIWGPVKIARVKLANEPAIEIPIQVIDSTFGTVPSQCGTPRKNPSEAGYSGILGVGLLPYDCGSQCTGSNNNNGIYYSCTGSNCTGAAVPLSSQVQNPVAALPQDNNGAIVKLPNLPTGQAPSVNGSLVFGIGTRLNNTPSTGVVAYSANPLGDFNTTLIDTNTSYSGFLDTGSNGLFFSTSLPSLPSCSSNPSWFCPSSTLNLSATNTGSNGSTSTVRFEIANFDSLPISFNSVFDNIGGSGGVNRFDWGLPFFFGRDVYVGFEGGTNPTLGPGPYWAY